MGSLPFRGRLALFGLPSTALTFALSPDPAWQAADDAKAREELPRRGRCFEVCVGLDALK